MKLQKLPLCLLATILVALFLWVESSFAAPPPFKYGQYSFTGEASCLSSTTVNGGAPQQGQGFDPSTFKANDKYFVVSWSVYGTRTFNSDGTGTVKGTTVNISYDNQNPAGASHDFTFDFTWVANSDGTFTTEMVPNSYQGIETAGPRKGQTVTVDNIELGGVASINSITANLFTLKPVIETHTFTHLDGTTQDVQQRICHRSRTLIWIGNN